MAKIDNSRVKVNCKINEKLLLLKSFQFFKADNSIKSLLNLWRTYLERTLQICSLKVENGNIANNSSEDVMIKVIIIIFNKISCIKWFAGNSSDSQYCHKSRHWQSNQ